MQEVSSFQGHFCARLYVAGTTGGFLIKGDVFISGVLDSFITILPFTAALMALKRKKRLEKQLGQIDGTLSTIEFQREALENAQTNTEVLKNMSFAAKALKSAHQHL